MRIAEEFEQLESECTRIESESSRVESESTRFESVFDQLESESTPIESESDGPEEIPKLRKADWNAEKVGSGRILDGMTLQDENTWRWIITFNILIGTRTDAKTMNAGLDRVPYRMEGNLKLYDITEQFQMAAKALPVGTLVKDEHFTLFESVGALEVRLYHVAWLFLSSHLCLVDWRSQDGQRLSRSWREIGRRL